jgi:hypothetical protein
MIGVEVLGDGINRGLGFWLCDGGSARRWHSVIWTAVGCDHTAVGVEMRQGLLQHF